MTAGKLLPAESRGTGYAYWILKVVSHPAGLLVLTLLLASFAVDLLVPSLSVSIDLTNRIRPPIWVAANGSGILGTDSLGRDLALRLLSAAKVSIFVSVLCTLMAGIAGTAAGVGASMLGQRAGGIVMRAVDGVMSFPGLLLAVVILYVFGPGFWKMVITLAMLSWPAYVRVVFASALRTREAEYVRAAQIADLGKGTIAVRYVLPSLLGPTLALASISIGGVMLSESALSYLGLGIQPPDSSWGLIISQGQAYFPGAWWETLFPGVAISITAISMNLWVSHAARQLDPRIRAAARGRAVEQPPPLEELA